MCTSGRTALLALLLALGLLRAGVVRAAEERDPTVAADAVQAALAANDDAALKELARRDHPDPWLVADVLHARKATPAAVRFAERVPRKDVKKLPARLKAMPAAARQAEARAALDEALAALAAKKPDLALAALKDLPGKVESVVAVRIHFARAQALRRQGEMQAALAAYEAAAALAESIGWYALASSAVQECGRIQFTPDHVQAAAASFERMRKIEHLLGSDAGQARARFALGLTSPYTGAPERVKEHLAAARVLAEKAGDREYYAKALAEEAKLLAGGAAATRDDKLEALKLSCTAARELKMVTGENLASRFQPDARRLAQARVKTLLDCARLAVELGQDALATSHAEEAQAEVEAAESRTLTLLSRAFLAVVKSVQLEKADRDLEALDELRVAAESYEALGGRYRLKRSDALRRQGEVLVRLGYMPQALLAAEQALELLGAHPPARALCRTLTLMGRVKVNIGRSEEGRADLDRCRKQALGLGDATLESDALRALSEYHARRGEQGHALRLLQEARDKCCTSAFLDATSGAVYLQLSQLLRVLVQPQQSMAAIESAIEVFSRGGEPYLLRRARQHEALLLVDEGRLDEAYAILQGVLAAEQARGKEGGTWMVYESLGSVRFIQASQSKDAVEQEKYYAEAHDLHVRAVKMCRQSGNSLAAAVMRSQVGRDLFMAGEDASALAELHGAFDECEELGSEKAAATCTLGLAEAYLALGRYGKAMEWAERGIDLASNYGLDLAEGRGEQARIGLVPRYRLGAKAAYHKQDAARLYKFLDRGRASALLAALGGREVLREVSVNPALREAEEQARAAAAQAHDARRRLGERATLDERRAVLDVIRKAQAGVEKAVTDIRSSVRMQADLAYPAVPALAEVQGRLAPGDAFVVYGEVAGEIVAVILTATDSRLRRVARASAVREAVQRLLADEDLYVDESREEAVRKLVLAPLGLGPEVTRLLISPQGSLAYVPFSLLDRKRDICFLPSATVFAALREQQEKQPRGKHILALGDPDYGNRDGRGAHRGWDRLKESRTEVERLTDPERGDTRLLDEHASETRLRKELASGKHWRAVHLACHGEVDPDEPRESLLALAVSDEDDGELKALEVFNMPVPADLVVLSGCETGRGKVIEGEGLEGLTRAFMFAGAPSVIASLWKVEDEATQALMTEFYRLWSGAGGKGLGAAEALRKAQEHVRTHPDHPDWKHPTYWAAWVLWGLPD